jgi:hypothetical protein
LAADAFSTTCTAIFIIFFYIDANTATIGAIAGTFAEAIDALFFGAALIVASTAVIVVRFDIDTDPIAQMLFFRRTFGNVAN